MAVGEGEYVSATFTTFLVVGVLILLTYIERILDDVNNLKIYKIECATKENALRDFEILLQQHKLRARNIKKIKTKESMTGQWEAYGKSKNHAKFIAEVWKDQRVMCFEFE
jgi:putative Mg2+ transporter-C (MgtC) family protein